jgi:hypothetical protein
MAETADLGPGGCLLVTPRPLVEGVPVRLAIDCSTVPQVLSVLGSVAWSGAGQQARAGVAFSGHRPGAVSPGDWFSLMVASQPGMASYKSHAPEKLALDAPIFLLPPERTLPELSGDEVEILERIENGMTARHVMDVRPGREPAVCRALFGLFAKRALTLSMGQSAPSWRWREVLGRSRDAGAAPRALASPDASAAAPSQPRVTRPPQPQVAPPVLTRVRSLTSTPSAGKAPTPVVPDGRPSRSKDAQECFDRARDAADQGQLHMAIGLLRRALLLAPRDPEIAALLGKLAFRGRQV